MKLVDQIQKSIDTLPYVPSKPREVAKKCKVIVRNCKVLIVQAHGNQFGTYLRGVLEVADKLRNQAIAHSRLLWRARYTPYVRTEFEDSCVLLKKEFKRALQYYQNYFLYTLLVLFLLSKCLRS